MKDMPIVVTLYHMKMCPPCMAFKAPDGEWEKFKSMANQWDIKTVEIERGEMKPDTKVGDKPIIGFPTVAISIDRREYQYEGDRTAQGIKNFIDRHRIPQKSGAIDYAYKAKKYEYKYNKLLQKIQNGGSTDGYYRLSPAISAILNRLIY